jgi:glucoamylase
LGEVIDGGFLELVRFGVKRADDPVVVTSVELCDRLLRVRTPNGDLWHRYTHDGYGEHADGSAYDGSGIGRAWPLLAGERGHYELALGGTADEAVRTMERVAGASGLLPEQVWDAPDIPARRLYFGEATGSARPLVWAHAEYVKLLRSRRDGRVFDRLEPVAAHFAHPPKVAPPRLWAFNQKVRRMAARSRLRLWLTAAATVRYSTDGWATATDLTTRDTGLGVHVADLPTQHLADGATVRFTFHWSEADRWEGQDFAVDVVAGAEDA